MDTANDDTATKLQTPWKIWQPQALGRLVESLYEDLLHIAEDWMRRERRSHTLQTAALVREAYLRFVELRRIDWRDRGHFFTVAAAVMRRVLIDRARAVKARKRGAQAVRVTLDEDHAAPGQAVDVLALDRALRRLAERDESLCHIVELRYFAGLSVEEIGQALYLASATLKRRWSLAEVWLYRELHAATA